MKYLLIITYILANIEKEIYNIVYVIIDIIFVIIKKIHLMNTVYKYLPSIFDLIGMEK